MIDVTFTQQDANFNADFSQDDADFSSDFGETSGVRNHAALTGRELPEQHPISAISNLETTLSGIMETVEDESTEPLSNLELENLLK